MQIIGHRGVSQLAPENSLASFELSLLYQQDYIELDVRCTKDGVPIVFHDARLWRLGKSLKKISNQNLAAIKSIVLKSGATIPTLAEVFSSPNMSKIKFDIELKDLASVAPSLQLIEDRIATGSNYDDFIISSLSTAPLYKAQKLNPKIRLVYIQTIFPTTFKKLDRLNLYGVAFNKYATFTWAIRAAKKQKLWTAVYTVNNLADARKFQKLGVDAIITNLPNPLSTTL